MTAIIYEIKHNSALCQVGQLSRSLNESQFTADHTKKSHFLFFSAENSHSWDFDPRKWHWCFAKGWTSSRAWVNDDTLRALLLGRSVCMMGKLFSSWCSFWFLTGWSEQSESCQGQDGVHAPAASACSQQLLQMVCSLCHLLFSALPVTIRAHVDSSFHLQEEN